MKLENETLMVLKNFSKINNSLFIEANSGVIKTLSTNKKILAEYRNCQSFPVDICIYDLSKFINVLSNLEDNSIIFEEHCLEIGKKTKIWYADPEIITYPTKMVSMKDIHVTMELTEDHINEIIKFSGILGIETVQITQEDQEIIVRLQDIKNPYSNTHIVATFPATQQNVSFSYFFSVENLKMLPGNYKVELTEKIVSHFNHQSMDLSYWIAMDSTSQISTKSSDNIKKDDKKDIPSIPEEVDNEDDIPF